MDTRLIFCSDVHLCHIDWYERSSADRMDNMINKLNEYYKENPYEKIMFLGDYSLDFWTWDICGSYLREGVNNAENFVKNYASKLIAPYHMMPGNHEQYGNEKWEQITGVKRDGSFVAGGYLIIASDNFSGILDPDFHSDGEYSPTKLDFVKGEMEKYPDLPVILCSHYFDETKEPPEFFEFLKNEKRIVFLICGHDHIIDVTSFGEKADNVKLFHDGHYSYAGGGRSPKDIMWGFCEAVLKEDGVDIKYVEPENSIVIDGEVHNHSYREQLHTFFKRRDI